MYLTYSTLFDFGFQIPKYFWVSSLEIKIAKSIFQTVQNVCFLALLAKGQKSLWDGLLSVVRRPSVRPSSVRRP